MSTPTVLAPGAVFARDYSIVRPLSEGGMGAVYVVHQLSTGAQRALKLMHPQLVREPRQRARFEQEARVGAQIESEHVVSVLGSGVDDASGLPWLVMELLSGQDLAGAIAERGALPVPDVRDIFAQLTHAVAAAHRVGIVHRDLKPENIFLAVSHREGQTRLVKVLDFGIAKVVAEAKATATQALGTPIWMAPEQTEASRSITPAADVWALGLIAFRMLTGKHFWISANSEEATATMVLREVVIDAIVPASQRAREYGLGHVLPPGFDDWFARCVVREPTHRFPDAGVARQAFSQLFEGGHGASVSAALTAPMPPAHSPHSSQPVAAITSPGPSASGPSVFVAGALTAPGPSPAVTPVPGVPLAPKAAPKRRSMMPVAVGALVVLGTMVAAAGLALRSVARNRTVEACDTETGDAKLTACREACAIDPKRACGTHGKLLLAKGDDTSRQSAATSFDKGCKASDFEACEKLGGLYETGVPNGLDRSPALMLSSYTRSCDGKNARGCGALGRARDRSPLARETPNRGLELITDACEKGADDISCADLAFRLERGKDRADLARHEGMFRRAAPALSKACDAGEIPACATLGYLQTTGEGIARDATAGAALLEKACTRGSLDACHNQASLALFGADGAKNLAASTKALQELCAGGSGVACNNVALLEARVPVAPKQQLGLVALVLGCSADVLVGCTQAGPIFAPPNEKPRTVPATKEALEKACETGVGFACHNLGGLVEAGLAGPREAVRALAAYEKGCKAGTLDGCDDLAGVPFKTREVWKGTYACGQGVTDVALRVIEESPGGDKPVKAIFDFDYGRGKAAGRFLVAGSYDPAVRGMTFAPGPWLERPTNYGTVGMKGELSLNKTIYQGRMLDPRCGEFRLVKQTGDMVGTVCARAEEAFVEGRGCVVKPRAGATALGTWSGKGVEASGGSWPMTATFTNLEDGLCATVTYPSLGCGGDWFCRGGSDGKTVRAREIITSGIGKCDTTGTIEMTVSEDGQAADWKWTSARPGSTAKLTRDK